MSRPPTSRRTVLKTLGLAGVGALGAGSLTAAGLADQADGAASPPPDGSTWPSYHNGVGNRGFNSASGGLADPLSRWETTLTGGACGPIVGPESVYLAQGGGTIAAVDRSSGETRWIADLEGEVAERRDETVLALADGRLIATVGAAVHAIDVADGTVQWRAEVEGNETSGPTVADGTVYCLTDHGVLLALEAATGAQAWRLESGFGETSIYNDTRNTPALSPDGSTVVVRTDAAIHAVAAADGTRQWRTQTASYMTPVVDDAVYVTDRGGVTSLSLADGGVRWDRRFDDGADTTPVVAHGQVFVQQYPNGVVAMDAATGETNWRADLPIDDRRPTLVADADHLYVPIQRYGDHNADVIDEIVALDPADGTENWRQTRSRFDQTDGRVQHLVPVDDGLIALRDSERLLRLESRPPGVRWRATVADDPDRAAVAGDGVVYAATTAGEGSTIAAIERDTGERRWRTDADVIRRPVADDRYVFTAGSALEARTAADGTLAWRTQFDGEVQTALSLADGTLYLGWGDGQDGVSAVDASDGSVCWSVGGVDGRPMDVGSVGPVVVGNTAVGDTVVAAVDEGLEGFATADGTRRWRVDGRAGSLAAGDGVVLAAYRRTVRAVTPDGDVAWTRKLSEPVTGLAHVGGTVVARTAGGAGSYRALSPADGSPRWELTTGGPPITMPRLAGGHLYAATGDGELLVIDPATGDVTATRSAFHGLHDRPAVSGDTVAVPSDEGFVYGFETAE